MNSVDREERYNTPNHTTKPTTKETRILDRLRQQSAHHTSGGSYNMLAAWVKGSTWHTGKNRLTRPANTIDPRYPELCGFHAELDLWNKVQFRGGTMYVAGTRESGTPMDNSTPCVYCAAILEAAQVRWVICYSNNTPIKTTPGAILHG